MCKQSTKDQGVVIERRGSSTAAACAAIQGPRSLEASSLTYPGVVVPGGS